MLKILAVGTGRSGTVSLTHWFNDLFKQNNSPTSHAEHEYLSAECYNAFARYSETKDENILREMALKCHQSGHDAIIGNGYANILPYFAELDKDILLIHLQRRDREACIQSLARNANYNPQAFAHYRVEDTSAQNNNKIERTTAFHVGEATKEEWSSWSLDEQQAWFYDYTHRTIHQYSHLFTQQLHIYTEDLNNAEVLNHLATLVTSNAKEVPSFYKLNSHNIFAIENCPPEYQHYIQWLFGRLDSQRAATNLTYPLSHVLDYFETWVSWCQSQSEQAKIICPAHALSRDEMLSMLKQVIPTLEAKLTTLKTVVIVEEKRLPYLWLILKKLARHPIKHSRHFFKSLCRT